MSLLYVLKCHTDVSSDVNIWRENEMELNVLISSVMPSIREVGCAFQRYQNYPPILDPFPSFEVLKHEKYREIGFSTFK